MTCTVTNRSGRLISFRGNSGETSHLPPFASIELNEVEVTNNPKIEKLRSMGLIAVRSGKELEQARPRSQAKTARSRHDKKR
jgi:hypothetical protein